MCGRARDTRRLHNYFIAKIMLQHATWSPQYFATIRTRLLISMIYKLAATIYFRATAASASTFRFTCGKVGAEQQAMMTVFDGKLQ